MGTYSKQWTGDSLGFLVACQYALGDDEVIIKFLAGIQIILHFPFCNTMAAGIIK